jgi:hypothetical protein
MLFEMQNVYNYKHGDGGKILVLHLPNVMQSEPEDLLGQNFAEKLFTY